MNGGRFLNFKRHTPSPALQGQLWWAAAALADKRQQERVRHRAAAWERASQRPGPQTWTLEAVNLGQPRLHTSCGAVHKLPGKAGQGDTSVAWRRA